MNVRYRRRIQQVRAVDPRSVLEPYIAWWRELLDNMERQGENYVVPVLPFELYKPKGSGSR